MGGFGSGKWHRFGKKSTIEESLSLGIGDFRKKLYPYSAGTFTWTWASGNQSSVGYCISWDGGGPIVTLTYRLRDETDVRLPIHLDVTYPALGGERLWLTCPLVVNGVACRRRVGKVYLPPGGRYFGCRVCHGLVYESSQEAHCGRRLFALLGEKLGIDPRIAKRLASRLGKERVK